MNSKESKFLYNAMKEEMNFIKFNEVWDLVDFPSGVKNIGFKCVLKTKKD